MANQRSFVMVKPDGVRRQLVGSVIERLEKTGLKMVAMKMVHPKPEQVEEFYPSDEGWLSRVGGKTMKGYEKLGIDIKKEMGTDDALEIGKTIKSWLVKYISGGPVVAMVWEGNRARDIIRKLVGNTEPQSAAAGTIRGDMFVDSFECANREFRSLFNIVHASETEQEAENEISCWFTKDDFLDYQTGTEMVWEAMKASAK